MTRLILALLAVVAAAALTVKLRQRRPTAAELLAMDPDAFEAFLRSRGLRLYPEDEYPVQGDPWLWSAAGR